MDQLVCLGVDGFEEPVEALDPVLCDKRGVQLQDVVLVKVPVDFRVEVRFFAHQFGEPLGARLPILREHCPFGQAMPNLLGLLRAKPKLPVSQQKTNKVQPFLKSMQLRSNLFSLEDKNARGKYLDLCDVIVTAVGIKQCGVSDSYA